MIVLAIDLYPGLAAGEMHTEGLTNAAQRGEVIAEEFLEKLRRFVSERDGWHKRDRWNGNEEGRIREGRMKMRLVIHPLACWMKSATNARSFTPGADSTPLATSTAAGCV